MQHAISSTAWVEDFLKLSTSEMTRENWRLIDDLKRRTTALEEKFSIRKQFKDIRTHAIDKQNNP